VRLDPPISLALSQPVRVVPDFFHPPVCLDPISVSFPLRVSMSDLTRSTTLLPDLLSCSPVVVFVRVVVVTVWPDFLLTSKSLVDVRVSEAFVVDPVLEPPNRVVDFTVRVPLTIPVFVLPKDDVVRVGLELFVLEPAVFVVVDDLSVVFVVDGTSTVVSYAV
jgi:hypothetical protein